MPVLYERERRVTYPFGSYVWRYLHPGEYQIERQDNPPVAIGRIQEIPAQGNRKGYFKLPDYGNQQFESSQLAVMGLELALMRSGAVPHQASPNGKAESPPLPEPKPEPVVAKEPDPPAPAPAPAPTPTPPPFPTPPIPQYPKAEAEQEDKEKEWYTVGEFSKLTGLGFHTIHGRIRSRYLEARKPGHQWELRAPRFQQPWALEQVLVRPDNVPATKQKYRSRSMLGKNPAPMRGPGPEPVAVFAPEPKAPAPVPEESSEDFTVPLAVFSRLFELPRAEVLKRVQDGHLRGVKIGNGWFLKPGNEQPAWALRYNLVVPKPEPKEGGGENQPNTPPPGWIRSRDFAQQTGLSMDSIRRMAQRNRLKAVKIIEGNRDIWYVDPAELDKRHGSYRPDEPKPEPSQPPKPPKPQDLVLQLTQQVIQMGTRLDEIEAAQTVTQVRSLENVANLEHLAGRDRSLTRRITLNESYMERIEKRLDEMFGTINKRLDSLEQEVRTLYNEFKILEDQVQGHGDWIVESEPQIAELMKQERERMKSWWARMTGS